MEGTCEWLFDVQAYKDWRNCGGTSAEEGLARDEFEEPALDQDESEKYEFDSEASPALIDIPSLLYESARKCNVATTRRLPSMGYSPTHRSIDPFELPLFAVAAQHGEYNEESVVSSIVDMLVEGGADLQCTDDEGMTALHFATLFNNRPAIKALLARGADIHARTYDGRTPLFLAWYCDQFDPTADYRTIELLQDAGADFSILDNRGRTVLHAAALCPELDDFASRATQIAINAGVPHHAKDDQGKTALQLLERRTRQCWGDSYRKCEWTDFVVMSKLLQGHQINIVMWWHYWKHRKAHYTLAQREIDEQRALEAGPSL